MNLEEAQARYIFCDGTIRSIRLSYDECQEAVIEIVLGVREKTARNKPHPCDVRLILADLIGMVLYDDFMSSGNYSDITLLLHESGYYLSLDPYGNTGEINEKDNMIFSCKKLIIKPSGTPSAHEEN